MNNIALRNVDPTDIETLQNSLNLLELSDRLHKIEMKNIKIGRKNIESVCDVITSICGGNKILLVTDATTIYNGEINLKEQVYILLSNMFSVNWKILRSEVPDKDIEASIELGKDIIDSIHDADCIVGIGGGTITDLCKFAAYNSNRHIPLIIIQTMLSVNAFSDGVSVMLKNGVKRTISTMFPTALIIDLDVVCSAPFERTLSGYGDLMATWTAPVDWLLSHRVGMNENYHSAPYEMLKYQNYKLLEKSKLLKSKEYEAFELLHGFLH